MSSPKTYLAGPIANLTYDEAQDWRDEAEAALSKHAISTFSPLRGKEYLKDKGKLTAGTYDGTYASAKGIMRRDHYDCTTADCVLVYLNGAEKVSIGTVMECAWAYDRQIPVVAVMEKDSIHNHVMLEESFTYRFDNLEDAVDCIAILLGRK